ncbi:Sodium-dependent phosphate transporter, partial [Operophtera brumata]
NGLLSSLPYLGKYLCALASSVLADSLRRNGKLSTTTARKLFTGFAVGLPGILMIAQASFGADRIWSIAIFTTALTINGANTAAQWTIVFYILAGTYVTGALTFVCFGSGDLQPWNARQDTHEEKREEQPLNYDNNQEKPTVA